MKKIKFLLFCSLLFFTLTIFAETAVQPFVDCRIIRSKSGWQYRLKYSAGFPFPESKLFLLVHYGETVKKSEIPLRETIFFDWKFSPETISFCMPPIKYDIPRTVPDSLIFNTDPGKILFPGRKVTLQTWKWTSVTFNGKHLGSADGKLELELKIPEHILKKYADAMSYEELVMQNFLKKINVPDYWRYAKDFPALRKGSRYETYPQVIRAHIVELERYQREYDAGEMGMQPILDLEILIMRRMLYAKNLPETMRQKIIMEIYQRYKQILSLKEAAFAAGAETKEFVDIAKSNLILFMKQHNIKE